MLVIAYTVMGKTAGLKVAQQIVIKALLTKVKQLKVAKEAGWSKSVVSKQIKV